VNIIEQRYDFLVDVGTFSQLDPICLKRLLYKLNTRHKGWLYNYLYFKLDTTVFNDEQLSVIKEAAITFYGKALL
jgi:hypothetical protein